MSRIGTKLLLSCLLICFGVFYGVNMATTGIERIHGPIQQEPALDQQKEVQQEVVQTIQENTLRNELRPAVPDKIIHRLADKTGEVIHFTVQSGVEAIVSIFEKVIH